MNGRGLSHHLRALVVAWAALLLLMLTSLGSAYLSLGPGNPLASFTIAFIKSAIVVVLFMRMRQSSAVIRIVAATAMVAWLLLAGLSGVDYATRAAHTSLHQPAQQLPAPAGRPSPPMP